MRDSWFLKQCPRCNVGDIHNSWGDCECVQCGYTPSFAKKYYSPMLAKLSDGVFDSDDHLYEPKYDGIRCIAYCTPRQIILINRAGNIITDKFPEVLSKIKFAANNAVFDGELVCYDGQVPKFQYMQTRMNRLHSIDELASLYPAKFAVFDLLAVDGWDVSDLVLLKRKELLNRTLLENDTVFASPYNIGKGTELFKQLESLHWEGIMAKHINSTYLPGQRTKAWLKLKCLKEAVVTIGGATMGFGKREDSFGALIVGIEIDGKLLHCGEVGTGFTDDELVRLTRMLEAVEVSDSPFALYNGGRTPTKLWCSPVLKAKVTFLDLTDDGILRHPSYQGLVK